MAKKAGFSKVLPDRPLTRSDIKEIDSADGIKRAISPTWQMPSGDLDREYSDDLLIITETHVRYFSRENDEGWDEKRRETYADDEEFEEVMDDVHDYACDYSEDRIEKNVLGELGI